jgi:hypothetical protein
MTCDIRFCAFLIWFITRTVFAAEPLTGIGATIFDPKAYGAAGDGVTDDTAAFADAVAAAAAVRGTVHIPAGTYVATVAVTKGGVTIEGEGKDATIIRARNTKAASVAGRVLVVANSDGTAIKDLTIDGNKTARSGKKQIDYALLVYQSSDCKVENVRVTDAEQIGIGISVSKRTSICKCEVVGSGCQNITTLNNKAGGCEGTVISSCLATNPGYDDIQITAVGATTVDNCRLADGPFAGIYVATGARNVTLRKNTITRCYSGIDMSWGAAGGFSSGPTPLRAT